MKPPKYRIKPRRFQSSSTVYYHAEVQFPGWFFTFFWCRVESQYVGFDGNSMPKTYTSEGEARAACDRHYAQWVKDLAAEAEVRKVKLVTSEYVPKGLV